MITYHLVGIAVAQGLLEPGDVDHRGLTNFEQAEIARGYTSWMLLKYPELEGKLIDVEKLIRCS